MAVLPQSAGLLAERLVPVESAESFLLKKNLRAQDSSAGAAELEPLSEDPNYGQLRQPIALKYQVELAKATAGMDQEHAYRQRTQFRFATLLASLSPVTPLTLGRPDPGRHRHAAGGAVPGLARPLPDGGQRQDLPAATATSSRRHGLLQINMIDLQAPLRRHAARWARRCAVTMLPLTLLISPTRRSSWPPTSGSTAAGVL